jgi:hydrogenase-4 component B
MSLPLVLMAIALLSLSGFPGLFASRTSAVGERVAVGMVVVGAIGGLTGTFLAVFAQKPPHLELPWQIPGGAIVLEVDGISALFLMPTFLISALGSVYGLEYWAQAKHAENGRKLRVFYGLLAAGLCSLLIARNTILFLAGWEIMALAAFFALTTEDHDPAVRESGFVYLVATRLSTLCLFALFALLHAVQGTFAFTAPALDATTPQATAMFLLALVGFGLKAGLMPLHVWLPGAHANAPSHVSALMSGVLIKMGVYGLVRVCSFFVHPPVWWGVVLVVLGAVSGVFGVVFAIAQHDIKRLLAYHSVENIGIIVMGLGFAVLGRAVGEPSLLVLGLAGALLHVWNHGLFKALLFLGAGSVVHATGTREMDRLGGLAKVMPKTTLGFVIGAAAICGLPPLNGFVSELFIYLGMFQSVLHRDSAVSMAGAFGAPALALIGALALTCFVKVVGVVFLGEPRTQAAREAHEAGAAMSVPMGVLGLLCATIGLAPVLVVPFLERATEAFAPEFSHAGQGLPALAPLAPLALVSVAGVVLLALIGAGSALLGARMKRSPQGTSNTWDCGYAAPSPTMQYTASSFADMVVRLFGWALRSRVHAPRIKELFAPVAHFKSHTPEVVLDLLVVPAARTLRRIFHWFRWLQRGQVHLYLLYVVATLVLLMFWR